MIACDDSARPWHKRPGEPMLWFKRFKQWLRQEKPRSFLELYNTERAGKGGSRALRIPHSWDVAKEKWDWQNRADAYDTAEIEREDRELARRRERQRARELEAAEK